jgi:hypothetical protein
MHGFNGYIEHRFHESDIRLRARYLYVARKSPYILKIHTPKSLQIYVNGLSTLFKAGELYQILYLI